MGHSNRQRSSSGFWVAVCSGIALLCVVVLLFTALAERAPRSGARERPRQSEPAARAVEPPRARTTPPRPAPGPAPSGTRGPRIESIELDKTDVCFGELNFATVRAYDGSGGTDRLIVRLSGSREMGFRLPFRVDRANERAARQVLVYGPGGPPAVAELPAVNVRDCEDEEQAAIEVSLDARSPHVLSLTAKLSEASGRDARERFEPVSYEWSFGDGTRQETNGSVVEHSYEGQPQKTRVSYFLIDVKIKDRRGRVVSGARAYGFPNFGFGAFSDERLVALFAAGGSREGEGAPGEERLRLYHGYEEAVELERVRTKDLVPERNEEIPGPEYSAQSLLGISALMAGRATTTLDLSALRPTEPGRIRELELIGHAGALEARGTLVLTATARSGDVEPADRVSDWPPTSEDPTPGEEPVTP